VIQDSTRNNLEALNLDVDLIALTAHELAPHSRELMLMNGLRAANLFRLPQASGRGQTRIGKLEPVRCSKSPKSCRKASIRSWRFGALEPWPPFGCRPRRTGRIGDRILTSPLMRLKIKMSH
jgi:hypothetical protein